MSRNRNIKNTFNIWAALFGLFYYIYQGLWKKGLILISLIYIISGIAQWFFPTASLYLVNTGLNVSMYGLLANIDIDRKKRFKETMWKELHPVFNNNWLVIIILVLSLFISIFLNLG